MNKLWSKRPSPAMVVAVIALIVALAGTAYAAQKINGNLIEKQTIGAGKLKKKTLTGFQINTNKLGAVPFAKVATHTFWAVVNNPASPGNAALTRASGPNITAAEGGGAVTVTFPFNVTGCADVAARNNAGISVPQAGYAQTNNSPANANAIEVRTKDKDGNNDDADFHLIVICP
ncbi:MAG TPA: hypothetical protein VGW80_08380 [Solirubrobacterales bacterium]|jgi:hypothetical protein|nr:hypothetical protein [Solirubrobacterales bacterium]